MSVCAFFGAESTKEGSSTISDMEARAFILASVNAGNGELCVGAVADGAALSKRRGVQLRMGRGFKRAMATETGRGGGARVSEPTARVSHGLKPGLEREILSVSDVASGAVGGAGGEADVTKVVYRTTEAVDDVRAALFFAGVDAMDHGGKADGFVGSFVGRSPRGVGHGRVVADNAVVDLVAIAAVRFKTDVAGVALIDAYDLPSTFNRSAADTEVSNDILEWIADGSGDAAGAFEGHVSITFGADRKRTRGISGNRLGEVMHG